MAHTYANNFIHCIFSTKDRRSLIPATRLCRSLRISRRHRARRRILSACRRWNHKSRSSAVCFTGPTIPCSCCSKTQRKLIPMDGAAVFLAGRVRSIQRQPFPGSNAEEIYSESRTASSQAGFRAGIHRLAATLRNRIRSALRLRLTRLSAVPTGLNGIFRTWSPC